MNTPTPSLLTRLSDPSAEERLVEIQDTTSETGETRLVALEHGSARDAVPHFRGFLDELSPGWSRWTILFSSPVWNEQCEA